MCLIRVHELVGIWLREIIQRGESLTQQQLTGETCPVETVPISKHDFKEGKLKTSWKNTVLWYQCCGGQGWEREQQDELWLPQQRLSVCVEGSIVAVFCKNWFTLTSFADAHDDFGYENMRIPKYHELSILESHIVHSSALSYLHLHTQIFRITHMESGDYSIWVRRCVVGTLL